ncbi:hypothetical protein Isop_2279 [Isosphaera pallida ATCC 43644]|uniref:Exo-alpha-sialidase n=1 Tax=Isosphaera pallida (strain ATCC 43644 / DSM 9630 / IS1B) TaxID=575540 RepID=E8R5V0_ISOPI|nr:hypothetical protein [Isosphaera pallida]ADV62857.1 hypothetical protein Isop_2279 [Isosphaera pallida ATCC 43644]
MNSFAPLPATWLVLSSLMIVGATTHAAEPPRPAWRLETVVKLWDRAPHNAFTDLIAWKDQLWCVFREGEDHVGGDGVVRVLAVELGMDEERAIDPNAWKSVAVVSEEGIDLRDPKLSIHPDGRLMLLIGASKYAPGNRLLGYQTRVAFSNDGISWTQPVKVHEPDRWLWRVTWSPQGEGFGVAYGDGPPQERITLLKTTDGLTYDHLGELAVDGYPNETTLRFLDDGTLIALVRREKGDQSAAIGRARPPYRPENWTWIASRHSVGGPNFLVLRDGSMIASGRYTPKPNDPHAVGAGKPTTTALFALDPQADSPERALIPLIALPSGGDTSYPGLVETNRFLWVSYYDSREGRTSIYLARLSRAASP